MESETISIVVPTHERHQKLVSLLRSISKYGARLVREVIVVDDSTSFANLPNLSEEIEMIHIKVKKRMFISRAKNLGCKKAVSKFIYLIDDDNVIDNTTIQPLLKIMKNDTNVGALMPAVLYKSRPDLVWVYATPFLPNKWGFQLIGRNKPRNNHLEGRLLGTDALPNACIVRSDVLEKVGGFNEELLINSSAEFCLKVKRAGWKVLSCTSSFIFHDVEPPGRLGWWASHGVSDPERVKNEVSDWFKLMKMVHPSERFFSLEAFFRSLGFLAPNFIAYMLRGSTLRSELIKHQFLGLWQGLLQTGLN